MFESFIKHGVRLILSLGPPAIGSLPSDLNMIMRQKKISGSTIFDGDWESLTIGISSSYGAHTWMREKEEK